MRVPQVYVLSHLGFVILFVIVFFQPHCGPLHFSHYFFAYWLGAYIIHLVFQYPCGASNRGPQPCASLPVLPSLTRANVPSCAQLEAADGVVAHRLVGENHLVARL